MKISRALRACGLMAAVIGACLITSAAQAKPQYAKKEGVSCVYCHVQPGGDRNFRGMFYGAHDHSFLAFDEQLEAKEAGVTVGTMGPDATPTVASYPKYTLPVALNFVLKDIDGKTVNLGRYYGKVVLLVNVASKCGFTPQYTNLQKVYEKYKDKGLVIVGIPANEFGHQEPGTDPEIKAFCTGKYNVTFPMMSKIVVKGEGIAPLYKYLTNKETDPAHAGDIKWNFTKFLIDRNGKIIDRFESPVKPDADQVTAEIEKLLATDPPKESASAQ